MPNLDDRTAIVLRRAAAFAKRVLVAVEPYVPVGNADGVGFELSDLDTAIGELERSMREEGVEDTGRFSP